VCPIPGSMNHRDGSLAATASTQLLPVRMKIADAAI